MTEALKSRLPDPLPLLPDVGSLGAAMSRLIDNGAVPQPTIGLVQLRAGQIVASSYHTVRQAALMRAAGESAERIDSLPSWRDSPYFTAAERAALALVEAVLTANPAGERVSDELFAQAAAHYDDKALWTLTAAIGQILFFVPVALIAKPIPGRPIGQNYDK
ncbi:carboxymuconolactone decarboxylase family protein [Dactylosporangium matsuzakiense]|uniref:Carboxymuconolactone decarboxylase-like domain-containing protein n=1 Tax=Dactylosporangium matsuzakiense TaxID=53360 RepID=A0A9W6KXN2_9ACTN|nr:carboxymuconolactone decarboxylase family protein [Dactylosporangium matsuzakiense]UWZ40905.1 carboxymuconolactone decarboxylase family protein [Dactylosporangium matsuzakiense]GLL08300.1 hypothetical protein GCM10017581_100610 [Dactylosporangium matsuzakiense]